MKIKGAVVLAFPLAKRLSLVRRLAEQMLARSSSEAEKHLDYELRRHRRSLARKQLPIEAIDAQLGDLHAAVRSELWRRVLAPQQPKSGR
jgi:hypothetical protein